MIILLFLSTVVLAAAIGKLNRNSEDYLNCTEAPIHRVNKLKVSQYDDYDDYKADDCECGLCPDYSEDDDICQPVRPCRAACELTHKLICAGDRKCKPLKCGFKLACAAHCAREYRGASNDYYYDALKGKLNDW